MERLPEVSTQGIKIYGLDGLGVAVVAVVFATALGKTRLNPVAGLITGAFEPGGVDKCFQKADRVIVKAMPVLLKRADIESQNLGGKMLNAHPGQNQEPDIVDDLVKVVLLGIRVPTDELVPAGHLPGVDYLSDLKIF
jgi:hypothetical protein